MAVWDTSRESKLYFLALDRDQGLGGGAVAPLPMSYFMDLRGGGEHITVLLFCPTASLYIVNKDGEDQSSLCPKDRVHTRLQPYANNGNIHFVFTPPPFFFLQEKKPRLKVENGRLDITEPIRAHSLFLSHGSPRLSHDSGYPKIPSGVWTLVRLLTWSVWLCDFTTQSGCIRALGASVNIL